MRASARGRRVSWEEERSRDQPREQPHRGQVHDNRQPGTQIPRGGALATPADKGGPIVARRSPKVAPKLLATCVPESCPRRSELPSCSNAAPKMSRLRFWRSRPKFGKYRAELSAYAARHCLSNLPLLRKTLGIHGMRRPQAQRAHGPSLPRPCHGKGAPFHRPLGRPPALRPKGCPRVVQRSRSNLKL